MWDSQKTKERLNELEDEVLQLKRAMKALELDWEDMYGKMKTLLARLNKRAEREEKGPEAPRTPDSTDGRQLSLNGDDRAAELNRRIREGRRGGAIQANGI